MKKYLLAVVATASLLAGCHKEEAGEGVIFDDIHLANSREVSKLSEMLGPCRLVQLETNDSCLIGGRREKFLKRDSVFYIMDKNEILEFDNDGRFLRKLSRVGGGPEDYTRIEDFEIVAGASGNEIWVVDLKSIKKYDAEDLRFLGELVRQEGFINQLQPVNDSTILVITPDERRLRVWNRQGVERDNYMDQDYPNGSYALRQFFGIGEGDMAYQIESHNQAVVYNASTGAFSLRQIFPDLEGTSNIETNREYFAKYGDFDFTKELRKNFDCLKYVDTHGQDVIWLVQKANGPTTLYSSNVNGKNTRHATFGRGGTTENDIVATTQTRFLMTACAAASDNGFLFVVDAEDLKDGNPESNPTLIEVTSIPD